jgi:hypothetical protein
MRWTVVWSPGASNDLATIWLAAPDRAAITRAAHRIDTQLHNDPLNSGESRSGNERVLFEPPLAVSYEVRAADRLVTVTALWQY